MTTASRVSGRAFSARHTSKPSISGIITSSRMRSGRARAAISSAARPLRAARIRCPLACRVRTSTCRLTGLSSTTRMVAVSGQASSSPCPIPLVARRPGAPASALSSSKSNCAGQARNLAAEDGFAGVADRQLLRERLEIGDAADGGGLVQAERERHAAGVIGELRLGGHFGRPARTRTRTPRCACSAANSDSARTGFDR